MFGLVYWYFYVTVNDIPIVNVTVHECAGGPKKKADLRFGSLRQRHFAGFFKYPTSNHFVSPTTTWPLYGIMGFELET